MITLVTKMQNKNDIFLLKKLPLIDLIISKSNWN